MDDFIVVFIISKKGCSSLIVRRSPSTVQIMTKISLAAQRDIAELKEKINRFKTGKIQEEKFKAYRLTRGVYGQRQLGVQMFRTKIPFGRLTVEQLVRVADVAQEFTNGNLHTTTRQNIQMHFVKLDDSPAIWEQLEAVGVTAREACGNTVRTVTASAKAGVDPKELFDVSPYAYEVSHYFMRNPICQEMGRKFKMAFSSSDDDSAFTYFHDLGFIPRIQVKNGVTERGFKVVIGGGLGAQAMVAKPLYDFLPEDQLIPFIEAVIRVFDRYGEREKRFKARMKFLINNRKGPGLQGFLKLVEEERLAIANKSYTINRTVVPQAQVPVALDLSQLDLSDNEHYQLWLKTNTFEQKQQGYYAVQIKLPLGNISSEKTWELAPIIQKYAADDLRITVNQGILLRFVRPESLPHIYTELNAIGLAEIGFDSLADITACPGTDTCNLAITNSTSISAILEELVLNEYQSLILDDHILIKISGCMNGCGQHMAANIGLHGSSIKNKNRIIPAMQVVLGGGVDPDGKGYIANKIIKLPTKRIPDAIRAILDDYIEYSTENEYFNNYVQGQDKRYFYNLLKPLANISTLTNDDYKDWDEAKDFQPAIGVGECAGVMHDLVGGIILDAEEKLHLSQEAIEAELWANSIYLSYSTFVIGAKALLLSIDKKCNTHIGILKDFDTHFVETGLLQFPTSFKEYVLQLKTSEPSAFFAHDYFKKAGHFLKTVHQIRQNQINQDKGLVNKLVIDNYYKA